jgi:hypothetical protein
VLHELEAEGNVRRGPNKAGRAGLWGLHGTVLRLHTDEGHVNEIRSAQGKRPEDTG